MPANKRFYTLDAISQKQAGKWQRQLNRHRAAFRTNQSTKQHPATTKTILTMTSISLKTGFGTEISITEDFSDIADFMESVTALLFAVDFSLHEIKAGYEAELERVKSRIQREIKEEQKTTENNE